MKELEELSENAYYGKVASVGRMILRKMYDYLGGCDKMIKRSEKNWILHFKTGEKAISAL